MTDLLCVSSARRFTRRAFAITVMASALAACGGGGGDGGSEGNAGPVLQAPPATAATLVQTGNEAMASVQALNSGATTLVQKRSVLNSGSLFVPVGASAAPATLRATLSRSTREQALARETAGCADLQLSNCSGSVTIDTNVDPNATLVPAGSYVALAFSNLRYTEGGYTTALNGGFRMDFLTAIDTNAASFANARLQITLSGFVGTLGDDIRFGPENSVALYEFNAQGVPSITIDGLRIGGLDSIFVGNSGNYTFGNVDLRTGHWGSAPAYIDLNYTNWSMQFGRPTVGSTASILAGTNATALVTVQSASQDEVTYVVRLGVGGAFADYIVTATYANNAPSYTVRAAAP